MASSLYVADAASIVQARQKDEQVVAVLQGKLVELLTFLRGQLFVNSYPTQIKLVVKMLYMALTTLRDVPTLGEEYVDLMYTGGGGSERLSKLHERLIFILGTCYGPILGNRLIHKLKTWKRSSWTDMVNILFELHLAVFYFNGKYYGMWKRLLGLRYVFSHPMSQNEVNLKQQRSKTYRILGTVLGIQCLTKLVSVMKRQLPQTFTQQDSLLKVERDGTLKGTVTMSQISNVSLKDPKVLPFIPKNSRDCILCLMPMTNPSCAPCGHIYCWGCILNWANDKQECPLCRQSCLPQQIQPLL